ncbi:MAG: T9SS type A sorting domain-containing protein [Saprospiraceae bacterium]
MSFGQCNCNPITQNASPDINCTLTFSTTILLSDINCTYPINVEIKDGPITLRLATLTDASDTIQLPNANSLINKTIMAISEGPNLTRCTLDINVIDETPPVFTNCVDLTIKCNVDTSVANLGGPTVMDNCSNVDLSHVDVVDLRPCNDPDTLSAVITRTWYAEDDYGNLDSCVQTINIKQIKLSEIDLEPLVVLDCENPDTDPSNTGFPTVNGIPLNSNPNAPFCNLWVARAGNESQITVCEDAEFKILRRWFIVDSCILPIRVDTLLQTIETRDTTPALIGCLDTIEVVTDPTLCSATFLVPQPSVTDNCTSSPTVTAEVVGVNGGFGPFTLPPGDYLVNYFAEDCSDSTSTCQTVLRIIDEEEPTAICREFTVVSLNSSGMAVVPARIFDEGSYDNCDDVGFLASRDMVNFTPSITFDCDDVGEDSIMMVLRVFELSRPNVFDDCMLFVEVQDKLKPQITCPPGVTIDCHDDYSDLTIFGSPTVVEVCGYTLTDTAIYNLSQCGVGTIERVFTATDSSGNQGKCSQVITVENNSVFNGNTIIWPLDTTFTICGPDTDPNDLPAPYDRPQLPEDSCYMFFTNHQDMLFNSSFPACYKILRMWTVLEMCSNQRFTYTQKIIVMDITDPVLTCPSDTVIAASANCTQSPVVLDPVTFTDCDPSVVITNNSPYAFAQGADASGAYPTGTTVVTFMGEDRCGNIGTCQTTITVEDLTAPTVKTVNRLSLDLGIANGVVGAWLNPRAFNAGSLDNCTAGSDLKFTIRPYDSTATGPATDTAIWYNCDDLGLDTVEVWVMDEAGNSDYVIVQVDVQDNFNRCPGTGTRPVNISGTVKTANGEPVAGVTMQLQGQANKTTTTDQNGFYEFADLNPGLNYRVVPFKNDELLKGISTFDLVQLSKHILNVQNLNTPYTCIAGDVNKSGSISTLDMVSLQKVILRISNEFPFNTSWRFVDKSYQFTNQQAPMAEPFNELLLLNGLNSDITNADFIAVKIGDINGDAMRNIGSIQNREVSKVDLNLPVLEFEMGEEIEIPFSVNENIQTEGFQMTFEFPSSAYEFLGIRSGVLNSISDANIGWSMIDEGKILVSWSSGSLQTIFKDDILFSFRFETSKNGSTKDHFKLTDQPLSNEWYAGNNELKSINLNENNPIPTDGFELYQNKPNPFNRGTIISFQLPEACEAAITIYDISGRVVKRFQGYYGAGTHDVRVNSRDFPQSGVYLYKLETERFTSTKKMVLL